MDSPYDTDAVARADQQSRLLRRRAAGELVNEDARDWRNIAESVGRSERAARRSHIATVLDHLIKLRASPAAEPRKGWKASVLHARGRIKRTLRDSPSLRREVAGMIAEGTTDVAPDIAATLAVYGEQPTAPIDALSHTEDQVLGDWSPGDPR
jgi:hypothetical protein